MNTCWGNVIFQLTRSWSLDPFRLVFQLTQWEKVTRTLVPNWLNLCWNNENGTCHEIRALNNSVWRNYKHLTPGLVVTVPLGFLQKYLNSNLSYRWNKLYRYCVSYNLWGFGTYYIYLKTTLLFLWGMYVRGWFLLILFATSSTCDLL